MSGLLVKDMRTLMIQGRYMLTVFGIFAVLMLSGNTATFMIGYATFVMMFFTISTISYDEADNGYVFMFTLPVSRRDYIHAKYVFGILASTAFWFVALAVTFIYRVVITKQLASIDQMEPVEFVIVSVVLLLASWIMMAIFLPIDFKYGVEKGRLMMLVIWGAVFGSIFIIGRSAASMDIDLTPFIDKWNAANPLIVMLGVLVVTVVIMAVSMRISVGVMEKKEF